MPGPLVVHVGLDPHRARALSGPPHGRARHVVGGPTDRADVVVLHGRAGRRAGRLRQRTSLVVRRPDAAERPSLLDRRALRWTDLVVVRAPDQVASWRAAMGRPGRSVVVAADDSAEAWSALVGAALEPAGLAAERELDGDLLLAPAEPTGSVERLSGSAPAVWRELAAGRTAAQAAAALRPGDPDAQAGIDALVEHLAARGLAVAP